MFSFTPLDPKLDKALSCPASFEFVEVQLEDLSVGPFSDEKPRPCILPAKYMAYAEQIRNLEVYSDDVWIVTFPKCGTTWTQEMVWLIDHDLDYEAAKNVNLIWRSVFVEIVAIADGLFDESITTVQNMARPRHIKSHLPMSLLPKKLWTVRPKIVYVSRNPKDVATSYWHHYSKLMGYRGDKDTFLEGLLDDKALYCPQVQHVLDFWRIRDQPNVLFLTYEKMKQNLRELLPQVCRFFGKDYSSEQLDELAKHLSFDVMKDNTSANNEILLSDARKHYGLKGDDFKFMRKGQVGDYKNELSDEYIKRFNAYIAKELRNSDFKYAC